jgi:hypothetical protein
MFWCMNWQEGLLITPQVRSISGQLGVSGRGLLGLSGHLDSWWGLSHVQAPGVSRFFLTYTISSDFDTFSPEAG